jgi:class 3 adenylate cyclase
VILKGRMLVDEPRRIILFVGSPVVNDRMGLSSGPVIAGMIGHRKFQYDRWGDAVNTASRMESSGTAGKIQITRETFELIQDEFTWAPSALGASLL